MVPVISTAPWKHIQIDLIDFHEFSEQNNGFAWLLSCVCIFSKFLFAIPMKNKEATTVATHLIKDVFKNFGPPETLQSEIISQVCNILQTPHHNVSCQILISSLSFSIILFYLLLTRKFTLTLDVVCYWYYMCMMADKTPFKDILWVGYDQLCPIQHMRIRK